MSNNGLPVKVTILDKEYLINCETHERASLGNAVDYLNSRMKEMKGSGVVIGSERIAVMTALNITHELLAYKQKNEDYTLGVDSVLQRLQSKINGALKGEAESGVADPVSQDNKV